MKVQDFISRLLATCCDATLYVMGGWGQAINSKSRAALIASQSYNQSSTRKKMINEAKDGTRAFDCSGLIKSILWGYTGDESATGGAKYASNGVPDLSASGLINRCYGVSTDMSTVTPGEVVYMTGHIGVYVGDGYVVESSPKWKNGVQRTELTARKWLKHGFLPYVEYNQQNTVHVVPTPTLRRGCRSMKVSQLQDCLSYLGYNLSIDGSYGPDTQTKVKRFQASEGIKIDGIYGPQTYNKLKEVMGK